MTVSSVKTSKCELNYAKCRSGAKNLIIMPGLSLKSILENASSVEAAYAEADGEYTIYLFEYPAVCPEDGTIGFIADAVAEALVLLGLKECRFFGASFGGMVGQVILAKHPELFSAAVFASTVARMTEPSPDAMRRWNALAAKANVRELNRCFFDAVYSAAYLKEYETPIRNALDNGNEDDCRLMTVLTGAILNADLREYDKKIKTPLLLVASDEDNVFSFEDISETARLSGGDMYVRHGYSHAVFDEDPDFRRRMFDFFA